MEAFNVGGSVKVDDHSRSNDTEARFVTYPRVDRFDFPINELLNTPSRISLQ
ncbi:hypothetical protein Halxa_0310 (plasmid) [Halopiger xanaduensis SH-6]|uniref:Uncharacterized protein n=1 Tax=Halopiger xanaduensis (strain DSM 18323 / JCM 14033 / SH-6) TaxID=797210 RepID=F8DD27_HALXS|nr:hypothetical protein Halxa_0310 [Halopiger xanaduensis SH-6]